MNLRSHWAGGFDQVGWTSNGTGILSEDIEYELRVLGTCDDQDRLTLVAAIPTGTCKWRRPLTMVSTSRCFRLGPIILLRKNHHRAENPTRAIVVELLVVGRVVDDPFLPQPHCR